MTFFVISTLLATQFCLQFYAMITTICRLRIDANDVASPDIEPTTIIVSIAGLTRSETILASDAMKLTGENTEVIFCASDATEPSARYIQQVLDQRSPGKNDNIKLLAMVDQTCRNPKVGNVRYAYETARYDAIVLLDGNVEIFENLISQIWQVWTKNVGLVSSTPIGTNPLSFWASVEATLLNGIYARWLLAGESLGINYASGKVLAFRRSWLDPLGGMAALNAYVGEDMALAKLAKQSGAKISHIRAPIRHPLNVRSASDFFGRALRWMRGRRHDLPVGYASEFCYTFWVFFLLSGLAAHHGGVSVIGTLGIAFVIWHIMEGLLVSLSGLGWSPAYHLHILVRDTVVLPMWFMGWFGNQFKWRGENVPFPKKPSNKLPVFLDGIDANQTDKPNSKRNSEG